MCGVRCRYKHAKQRDIENARDRGNSIHQSRKKPLSLTQAPVNTEEFLNQKEEDVAVEDQFFYKFFKERARRNVGKAKKSKKEEEDEEAEMDKFAEDMADEMLNQKVGSEDDDILDDFEQDENGRFLDEDEEVDDEEDDFGIEDEEDGEEEEDTGMILDEGDDGSKKKTEKHKKKMKSLYASAEEFESMLAATAEEREKKEKNRKNVKRRPNRKGKGFSGKKRR